jgi:methyl-accepting chemotaxis protein
MASMNEKTEQIAESDLPAVGVIGDLSGATSDFRAMMFKLILTPDAAGMAEVEKTLDSLDAGITTTYKAYVPFLADAEDRGLHETTQREWRAYVAAMTPVRKLALANQSEKARVALVKQKPVFDKFTQGLGEWSAHNAELGRKDAKAAHDAYTSARTTLIALLLVAVVLGLGIALFLASKIRKGVDQMKVAAEGIAQGDLEQNVSPSSKDELGDTAVAFGSMIEYLKETASAAERVGEGDLSVEIAPRSERDVLRNAFVRMVESLRLLVSDVTATAGTVSSASQQLASTSEEAGRAVGEIAAAIGDVAQGAETQVRRVEDVRVSMTEAAAAVDTSAREASEAAQVADETREVVREGVSAAASASGAMSAVRASSADVSSAMGDLASKSEQIGGIIATITGIAEQTNLLALNAAIEAARAGEQGRGFAVVAEEVRKLAEESQQAAASIGSLVDEIQGETRKAVSVVEDGARRTEEGTSTVEQVQSAFARIEGSVNDMTARVEGIAAAAKQVAASTEKMQVDIADVARVSESTSASSEEVSASTQQTSASTQEISASAQELASTAQALEDLVSRFRLTAV